MKLFNTKFAVVKDLWFEDMPELAQYIHFGEGNASPQHRLLIRHNEKMANHCLEFKGVPFFFGEARTSRDAIGRLVLHADLVSSAFYLLTRLEEVQDNTRDQHGRFPGKNSLPFRYGFLNRPVVDQYRELIVDLLREEGVPVRESQAEFQLVLTHDIDDPFRYLYLARTLGLAGLQMIGKRRGNPLTAIKSYMGITSDPFDTFQWMNQKFAEVKEHLGNRVRQIYFVMACDNGPNDKGYTVEHPRIRKLLQQLKKSGAEFGLHPSYKAGSNPEEISKEKKRLEDVLEMPVTQTRHHYLRLREPSHTNWLIDAGFTDDYSAGYADVAGFRNGTTKPFRYFDLEKRKPTSFKIHPLPIMECTFEGSSYMNLECDEAIRQAKAIAQHAIDHSGELVLLWHNPTFASPQSKYHTPFYENLLNYICQQNALQN